MCSSTGRADDFGLTLEFSAARHRALPAPLTSLKSRFELLFQTPQLFKTMQSLLKRRFICHILQLKPRELTLRTRTLCTAQRQIRSVGMGLKTDITLYTASTPNGIKVPILLEELGLEYKVGKNILLRCGISSCLHMYFSFASYTMLSLERMSRNCLGFWTSIPMAGFLP